MPADLKQDAAARPATENPQPAALDEWDLDISIVEQGPAADQLVRLTDDNCNSTCATACTSCP